MFQFDSNDSFNLNGDVVVVTSLPRNPNKHLIILTFIVQEGNRNSENPFIYESSSNPIQTFQRIDDGTIYLDKYNFYLEYWYIPNAIFYNNIGSFDIGIPNPSNYKMMGFVSFFSSHKPQVLKKNRFKTETQTTFSYNIPNPYINNNILIVDFIIFTMDTIYPFVNSQNLIDLNSFSDYFGTNVYVSNQYAMDGGGFTYQVIQGDSMGGYAIFYETENLLVEFESPSPNKVYFQLTDNIENIIVDNGGGVGTTDWIDDTYGLGNFWSGISYP